jgi:RNA polymerase sigma-70 factor (subfamily 1)
MPPELERRLDSSDVIQEALCDAVKHFEQFEYRGEGSFRAWLGRILQNRVRMEFNFHLAREKRSARREVALPQAGPSESGVQGWTMPAEGTSPSNAASLREERERLQRALAGLPEDYRTVIRAVKLEGKGLAEVAAEMGRSENAVKKLLARALLRSSEALKDGGAGAP